MSVQPDTAPVDEALPADERTRRALQEAMLVFDDLGWAADANGLAIVYAESGQEHRVDVIEGRCDCDDQFYRDPDNGCKHVRRAAIALGYLPLPSWVSDRSRLDSYLRDDLEALDGPD